MRELGVTSRCRVDVQGKSQPASQQTERIELVLYQPNRNGPGAPSIRVDFDDDTDGVRVSFLPTSPNYVEADMYEAI